jgi:predicted ATPase
MLKQALCDALVGRDAELSSLEDALLTAGRDRSGGLVLLEGEAGMGKTRLAHELADRARGGAAVPAVRGGARQLVRRT